MKTKSKKKSAKVGKATPAKVTPKAAAKGNKSVTAINTEYVTRRDIKVAHTGWPIAEAIENGDLIDVELVKKWNLLMGKSRKG